MVRLSFFEDSFKDLDLLHVVLDVRPVPPQPLTLLLGVRQSHPQEGKLRELPHHTLDKFLRRKQQLGADFDLLSVTRMSCELFELRQTCIFLVPCLISTHFTAWCVGELQSLLRGVTISAESLITARLLLCFRQKSALSFH